MNLSVIILTKNEEKNIRRSIESVQFVDEVIVVDDKSTDNTRNIARKMGARVFKRSLSNDFASQRNFSLSKARGKWILFIDADEVVTPQLAQEIIKVIKAPSSQTNSFIIRRHDVMWDVKLRHGESGDSTLTRLAKKNSGKWRRQIHEVWEVKGGKMTLKNELLHYPHPTLREFIEDVNRMSSLHARANFAEGKRSSVLKVICWPLIKFVRNYFWRGGFLDSTPGFISSAVMSFHSFLAWGKLLMLQKHKL